jgi:hypothetical protein
MPLDEAPRYKQRGTGLCMQRSGHVQEMLDVPSQVAVRDDPDLPGRTEQAGVKTLGGPPHVMEGEMTSRVHNTVDALACAVKKNGAAL